MIIKKENAVTEGFADDSATAETNLENTNCPRTDFTTSPEFWKAYLDVVRELSELKTKMRILRKYAEEHYIADDLIRIIAKEE